MKNIICFLIGKKLKKKLLNNLKKKIKINYLVLIYEFFLKIFWFDVFHFLNKIRKISFINEIF